MITIIGFILNSVTLLINYMDTMLITTGVSLLGYLLIAILTPLVFSIVWGFVR